MSSPKDSKLMIDIETLGLRQTSIITQIGWCLFTPKVVLESGLISMPIGEQIMLGRTVDEDTLRFWAKQKNSPFTSVTGIDSLEMCFSALSYQVSRAAEVWANGVVFDIGTLEHWAGQIGHVPPWKYSAIRDYRTYYRGVPNYIPYLTEEVTHNGEEDAVQQAEHLIALLGANPR